MIVNVPAFITIRRPITREAMLDRFRIRNRQLAQRSLKIAFDFTEEREVTLNPKLFGLCPSPENDVHLLRLFTLNCGNQHRIETELHQRACFCRLRQLGLNDFVRPWSKLAWSLHSQQEVRSPTVLTLNQRRLIDSIYAPTHRRPCRLRRLFPTALRRYLNNREPAILPQPLEILRLVLQPQLPEQLRPRICIESLLNLSQLLLSFERGDMLASKKVGDVSSEVHRLTRSLIVKEADRFSHDLQNSVS